MTLTEADVISLGLRLGLGLVMYRVREATFSTFIVFLQYFMILIHIPLSYERQNGTYLKQNEGTIFVTTIQSLFFTAFDLIIHPGHFCDFYSTKTIKHVGIKGAWHL